MRKREGRLTRLRERLSIPSEMKPGGFGLSLSGREELCVRGCRRILSYSPDKIELRVGKDRLFVNGEDLLCRAFGAGCVTICGRIVSVSFTEGQS